MVAAAVIGAAAIGAAGTAVASSNAASATQNASNAAIAQQQAGLSQQAQLSAPYRALGSSAIPKLQAILGLTPGSSAATQEAALATTPGYNFTRNQGIQAATNEATASGLALSGNTLEALEQFGSGLADQTFQQQVGNLENVVNTGQAAAAGQAANVGNAASNIGNTLVNQGNTLAGIDANEAAGITKTLGNAANQYTTLSTLNSLNSGGGVSPGVGNAAANPSVYDTSVSAPMSLASGASAPSQAYGPYG